MRSYPTNSPEALARLIAMAILADGRLDNREVDWIKHNDTAALLGVDRDTLIQVLLDCCRDVINEAEQERVFLLEDHRLARLADDHHRSFPAKGGPVRHAHPGQDRR
jgi:hypothetical protein